MLMSPMKKKAKKVIKKTRASLVDESVSRGRKNAGPDETILRNKLRITRTKRSK